MKQPTTPGLEPVIERNSSNLSRGSNKSKEFR